MLVVGNNYIDGPNLTMLPLIKSRYGLEYNISYYSY